MRKLIIDIFLFMLFGGLLASTGCAIDAWQFWVLLLSMVGVQVNSSI